MTFISEQKMPPLRRSVLCLPASNERAIAKLDFRLVPDQKPEEIEGLFRRHVDGFTPATVRSFLRKQASAKPAMIDRRHPAMRAAFSR